MSFHPEPKQHYPAQQQKKLIPFSFINSTRRFPNLQLSSLTMAASVVFGFTPATSSGVIAPSSTKLHFRTKANSELGFLTSQLAGIKISSNHSLISTSPISTAPLTPALQPVARNIPLLLNSCLIYFHFLGSTCIWLKHFLFELGF